MSPHPALPISLYLTDRPVLVIGEGATADDRAARFAAAGARLTRIAPSAYRPDMCDSAFLVVAVSGDRAFDAAVSRAARARGRLVYAHDQPEVSDLAMPAVARRGALSVAFATDGVAPALARRLREEADRLLTAAGPRLDALLAELGRARSELRGTGRLDALYRMACRLRLDGAIAVDD